MIYFYLSVIFVITFTGGSIPLLVKNLRGNFITYLLAFTGAFLLGITILHLMPEVFHDLGNKAGIFILSGFFLQVFLQQFSHGMEHSHFPSAEISSHTTISTLLLGLSVHAFIEGIPLGYHYSDPAILPSLVLGISLHKLPVALTLMTAVIAFNKKNYKTWLILFCFAVATPIAALLALYFGSHFAFVTIYLQYVIALVIGAFLHISTTIFFESGTRRHELSKWKLLAVLLGLAMAFGTMLLD
jgi:zinc and cadmium transporter